VIVTADKESVRILWQLRYRRRIPLRETALVPIGIDGRCGAGGVQFGDLRRGEVPAHGSQILAELVRITRADDHGGYGRSLEQPPDCDLWHGFASFFRHFVDGVHSPVDVLVGNWRSGLNDCLAVEAADFGHGLPAPYLPGKSAPAKRTPDDCPDLLVQRQRHQLPFVSPARPVNN
jgi:hypothetical protein